MDISIGVILFNGFFQVLIVGALAAGVVRAYISGASDWRAWVGAPFLSVTLTIVFAIVIAILNADDGYSIELIMAIWVIIIFFPLLFLNRLQDWGNKFLDKVDK